MLVATLGASLSGNLLAGRKESEQWRIRAGKRTNRVGQDFYCCLIL